MTDLKKSVEVLQSLAKINRDAEAGFREFGEKIKNSDVKQFFLKEATIRADFAGELQNEAIRHGEHDPDRGGHAVAGIHRGWAELRANLGAGDEALVDEAERGEDTAKKAYEEALQKKLPGDSRGIIESQAQHIRQSHDTVRNWRDRRAA